jgi:hypothetical protein
VLSGLLYLLPALTLALVLLARRYPGERTLLALRRRPPRVRWPRPRSNAPLAPPVVVLLIARGGLLIARSLAVRPPPALRAAS